MSAVVLRLECPRRAWASLRLPVSLLTKLPAQWRNAWKPDSRGNLSMPSLSRIGYNTSLRKTSGCRGEPSAHASRTRNLYSSTGSDLHHHQAGSKPNLQTHWSNRRHAKGQSSRSRVQYAWIGCCHPLEPRGQACPTVDSNHKSSSRRPHTNRAGS
jgi:hypothetical protein